MASLKDLRNRIASVKATQKITKAMQMVAAAKLRRAQASAEAARPYAARMEAVAMFASDLDAASKAQLARGARLVELLKQPQSSPYPVEEQVVSVWAGTNGKLDDVAVEDVRRFETELLDFLRRERGGILEAIRETKELSEDTEQGLGDAIEAFKRQFEPSQPAAYTGTPQEEEIEALGDADVDQERIVRKK